MIARIVALSASTALLSYASLALAAGEPKSPGAKSAAAKAGPATALDAVPSPSEADPLTPPESSGPLLAPGAEPSDKPAEAKAAEVAPAEVDPIVAAVRRMLASDRARSSAAERADYAALASYYGEGAGKPIWTEKDGGLSPRGRQAVAEIEKAADWGLSRQAFALPAAPKADAFPDAHADAEIRIGIAALTYARHARGGRIPDPSALTRLLDRKPRLYEPKSLLQAFAKAEAVDAYLRGLHPKHPQFEKLRQALLSAQGRPAAAAEDKAADIRIPAGPRIKPGASHPHIALIRQRLGIAAEPGKEAVYDDVLQKAVMAWQSEHGQEPTGLIGNDTRVALNGTARRSTGENAQRLIVNMERWRWMPDELGGIHVWDSVTEQMTKVVKDGKVLFHEKIVVGKVNTPTPSFSADMQFIIFHPSWGVPNGIKMNELAPLLRRASGNNSGFLFFGGGGPTASSVLEGVGGLRPYIGGAQVNPDSVNWSAVDIRNVSFVQPPGPRNVLGIVKFRFPNKHDVYMHDTPERHLFNTGQRTFSHGCMRVQNPVRLAEVLLAHDKGWSAEKVQGYVRGGQGSGEIKLTTPIPVHVAYFTQTVEDDGKVHNHPDIYGLDSRIATALAGRQMHIMTSSIKPEKAEKTEKAERSEVASATEAAAGTPRRRERASDPAVRTERQLRPRRSVRTQQASSGSSFNPFAGLFGN